MRVRVGGGEGRQGCQGCRGGQGCLGSKGSPDSQGSMAGEDREDARCHERARGTENCRAIEDCQGFSGPEDSRGSVTAEFAVLLPVLAMMLAMDVCAGAAGVAKLRCIDAARSAARLAARHESTSTVLAAARSAGPRDAAVRLSVAGELVRVQVTARVPLPLPGQPSVDVGATSVALLEEAADG
jgi:hypothetical protein